MAWSAMASRQARSAWRLASKVQGAAGAQAHAVPAPASGNRGNQLVVGAHGRSPEQKQETPGSLHLPGLVVRKAQAFRSRRKAWSGGDARLGHAGRDVHGSDCVKEHDHVQAVHAAACLRSKAALTPSLFGTATTPSMGCGVRWVPNTQRSCIAPSRCLRTSGRSSMTCVLANPLQC
jgi:hypothetical protein